MARELSIAAVRLGGRPAIVAAGGEQDLDALVAADGANVTELRGDLFEQPTPGGIVAAIERLRAAGRPIIFTARAAAEGGRAMPEELRARALSRRPAAGRRGRRRDRVGGARRGADRAGAPGETPGDPVRARLHGDAVARGAPGGVERARTLGADLPKLATHAATPDDLRTLLDVTLAARADGVVTLGMGPLGPLSRLVLPAAGSLLTYGAAGRGTAPGQLPVAELASLVARLFPS